MRGISMKMPDFARACAVQMHMDISQKHFYAGMYNKNAAAQRAYPDQTPA
jgi:hypothetical protein